jgi:hypothetical protein
VKAGACELSQQAGHGRGHQHGLPVLRDGLHDLCKAVYAQRGRQLDVIQRLFKRYTDVI